MSALIGLSASHRTLPLDSIGRLVYREDEVGPALDRLLSTPGVAEAVILSTCNRTEIYAVVADGRRPALERFLAGDRALDPGLTAGLRPLNGRRQLAGHLFRVAAGLESLLVGEEEIQGQIRSAHRTALDRRAAGAELDGLFRWAVQTGRRVRRETVLGVSRRSLGRAAVANAAAALDGGLRNRKVLVVGAGKMARAVVEELRAGGATVIICSRTEERARRLAQAGDVPLPLAGLARALEAVDAVLCCTSAPHMVIAASDVAGALARRRGRPLLLLDLSVPRDVEPAAGLLPGVRLLDLEDLGQAGVQDAERLAQVLQEVERIVDEETERYLAWVAGRQAGAVVAGLKRRVAALCEAELEEAWRRSGRSGRAAATTALQGSLAKLFYGLSHQAREAALSGDEEFLARLSRLLA